MNVDFTFGSVSEGSARLIPSPKDDKTIIRLKGTITPITDQMQKAFPGLEGNCTCIWLRFPRRVPGKYKLTIQNPLFKNFYQLDPCVHEGSGGNYYLEKEVTSNGSRMTVLVPIGEQSEQGIQVTLKSMSGEYPDDVVVIQNQLKYFQEKKPVEVPMSRYALRRAKAASVNAGRAIIRVISY